MINYLKKINNFLLIIFLFILPLQTRWIIKSGALNNEYWEYSTLSLYLTDALFIVIIIFNFLTWRAQKIKNSLSKNDWLLLIFFFIGAGVNLYFSQDRSLSLFHFSWLLLALGLFTILRQKNIPRTTGLLSLIIGAALSSGFGAWQFLVQKTIAFKWLGLAQHKADELGSSVVEAVAPDGIVERWLRAYGSLDHPNMLGGLAAITIFFCLYLVFNNYTKSKKEIIVISAFILLLAGLIASFSRAGLIAVGIGGLIYFIFSLKADFKAKIRQASPFIIIGITIIVLFTIPYYYLLVPRFSFNTRLEKISVVDRVAGYQETWPIIKTNPILGTGLGVYSLALNKIEPKKIVWFYQPIHNTWFLLLAETGLVGLIIWLWFIISKVKTAWKKYPEERIIILGTVAILFFIGLFDHWLMSLHFGIMLTATSLGLALKK